MTKRLLAAAELTKHIAEKTAYRSRASVRIGIKPNLVTPAPADFGGTTHPEIIAAIIEYLQAAGYPTLAANVNKSDCPLR